MEESTVVTYYRAGAEESLSKNLIVAIDVEQALFANIMNETDGMDGTFSLYNASGNLAASTTYGKQEGNNIYTVKEDIGEWMLEAEIPLSQFTGITVSSQIITILVLVGCIFVILVLANLTARHTVQELKLLENSSERAMEGKYESVQVNSAIHEIRTLQLAHNAMMDNIDELIHDIYMSRLKHISILYEQIKPHFLYNTLERAKWLARKNSDDEIMIFLEKFAQFLHLFLSEGKDLIPIRQELKHVGLYVDLMTFGTDKKIIIDTKIPEELQDENIIKLILQPLVENSIIHGLFEKDNANGVITISARADGLYIEITISDDGVGIDEDKLTVLNSKNYAGYGTKNTKKRLELCYEDDYSIKFANNENGGASVKLRIPKRKK
jgi:two-component system sensor histidine kinase YesM